MGAVYNMLNNGLSQILAHGYNCQVKLINYSIDENGYDDDIIQTVTGSSYTSGLVFPLKAKQGSSEALLLEQGKLLTQDKVLYLGSAQLNSSGLLVGIGSPTEYFTIVPNGIQTYNLTGSIVYSKLFLRHTIPGSLFI